MADRLAQANAAIDVGSQAAAEESLAACRQLVGELVPPPELQAALLAEMKEAGMPALPAEPHRRAHTPGSLRCHLGTFMGHVGFI